MYQLFENGKPTGLVFDGLDTAQDWTYATTGLVVYKLCAGKYIEFTF